MSGLLATAIARPARGVRRARRPIRQATSAPRTGHRSPLHVAAAGRASFLGFPRVALELASDRPVAPPASASARFPGRRLGAGQPPDPEPHAPRQRRAPRADGPGPEDATSPCSSMRTATGSPPAAGSAWPSSQLLALDVAGARAGHAHHLRRPGVHARAARAGAAAGRRRSARSSPGPSSRRRSRSRSCTALRPAAPFTTIWPTGRVNLVYDWDVGGRTRLPNGLEVEDSNRTTFSIVEGDPLSASVRVQHGRVGRPRRVAHAPVRLTVS